MNLVPILSAVLGVAALGATFMTYTKLITLGEEVKDLRKIVGPKSPGDDQPLNLVGGSLFLGNDPAASWKLSGTNLVYETQDSTISAERIEIIVGTGPDSEEEYWLERTPGVALTIVTTYGRGGDYNKVTLATGTDGKNLTVSATRKNGTPLNASRFMSLLPNLRRHPKKDWAVQTISITGAKVRNGSPDTPSSLTDIKPTGSEDISLLLHYCQVGKDPC